MNKKTCGEIYLDALKNYAFDDASIRIFAAGFINGQCEKIYLGACRAAMFRPSKDRYAIVLAGVYDAATRYELSVYDCTKVGEIWVFNGKHSRDVKEMLDLPINSAVWHRNRAWLCGIPTTEMDDEYHLRECHGERCDI